MAAVPSVLCVFVVALRVWTRWRSKKYDLEDTLLVIATALNLVLSFTTCGYIISSFYGYHVWNIPEGAIDPILMMKWNYANSIIYNPILALVKLSFILTLIKLRSPKIWINYCLWAMLCLNACFAVGAPLACIMQCNPIAKYWDRRIIGSCVHAGAYTVSTSSIVLATDVLILVMPSWMLHDLSMPLGRKLMVIVFLSFGIAVTVVGAVRTSVLVKKFVIQEVVEDPTYGMSYTLSNVESALAILGTCGPTVKNLLGLCIPSLKTVDESRNRFYGCPNTGRSQGERQTRPYAVDLQGQIASKEIDEGTKRGCHCSRSFGSSENFVMINSITKTVTLRAAAAQIDSHSENEQPISTPHNTL
ncbi:hypothetical protein HBH96_109480 [Parastagonospora nodorum]|nr:hypothetical protein HBH96_109480 [Parastagonospora nodorum]